MSAVETPRPSSRRYYRPGARRTVLTRLRAINESLRILTGRWNVSGTVLTDTYETITTTDAFGNVNTSRTNMRKRAAHEWPENDHAEWLRLASECRRLQRALSIVEKFATDAAAGIESAEVDR